MKLKIDAAPRTKSICHIDRNLSNINEKTLKIPICLFTLTIPLCEIKTVPEVTKKKNIDKDLTLYALKTNSQSFCIN